MKKIIMEALYGEYNNLYGDRGNLLYVQEKLRRAGVEFELIQTHLFDRPAFTERAVDLLYIGPCTESQQEQELAHLRPYADALRQRMEGDGVTLATGNAFELFGETIVCEDGRRIQGLGFWPTTAKRFSNLRYNELCLGNCGEHKIVGFKLLPLNPQFALSLLQKMAPEAEFAPLPYEDEAYRLRLEELSRPDANHKAH